MNNNITEDYCSFEVSKLLKKKGFDIRTNSCYPLDRTLNGESYLDPLPLDWVIPSNRVYRPTHALAIKWIRENFGIHIYVDNNHIHKWWYCVHVIGTPDRYDASQFKLPEEATEAALLYTLNNLI